MDGWKRNVAVAVASGVLGAVLVGGAGCSNAPFAGQPDNVPTGQYPRVVVEAPLNQFVGVDYNSVVVDQPTSDRPLAVTVPVRSLAPERRMNVQYQFTWLDRDGRQVGQSGWRYIVMEPRTQDRFSANAMDTRATDYRLEIRSAR
jgi:uncharacterized protein YcfL